MTAKSQAGSLILMPPLTLMNTSWRFKGISSFFSNKAMSMLRRLVSNPFANRLGAPKLHSLTNA